MSSDAFTHRFSLFIACGGILIERIDFMPQSIAPEGELRRLRAAAPAAAQDVAKSNASRLKGFTNAPCRFFSFWREITLGRAIVDAESGWITDAGRGDRVAHKHDLTAVA